MTKKITRLFLNPNEMAFRKYFWPQLESQTITKVFRPGSRLEGDERGYKEGRIVVARVIDSIGSDWAGIPPEFFEELSKRTPARILKPKYRPSGRRLYGNSV